MVCFIQEIEGKKHCCHSFLSFPYVWPEPVLVKSCISDLIGAKSRTDLIPE